MLSYAAVKTIHQTAVVFSLTGFAVRGVASLLGAQWVRSGMWKRLPHAVDSVLLLSALTMAWILRLTPDRSPWLLAKVIGLVVYVALGVVALRPERPLRTRAAALVGALVVAGWIVSVAMTKNVLGFFSWMV